MGNAGTLTSQGFFARAIPYTKWHMFGPRFWFPRDPPGQAARHDVAICRRILGRSGQRRGAAKRDRPVNNAAAD
jgi:hypothetical protein